MKINLNDDFISFLKSFMRVSDSLIISLHNMTQSYISTADCNILNDIQEQCNSVYPTKYLVFDFKYTKSGRKQQRYGNIAVVNKNSRLCGYQIKDTQTNKLLIEKTVLPIHGLNAFNL
jgi:hypothetical protein